MNCPPLAELSSPPPCKIGWPWTDASPQLPDVMPNGTPWPRVSIVTPSFNQGEFLEETIRSVLLQGYPNLEYIVIDGGSTDGSVDIIRKYEKWLASWTSEPDRGQAHAINKGFRLCSGEIMAWLNSDDCFRPGAIFHAVDFFRSNPNANVISGFRRVILGERISKNIRVYLKPDAYSLSRNCYLPQETVFWRRSVWETVGELDETFQFAMDFDFWQRILAAKYEFILVPRFTSLFRVHPDSKGSRKLDTRSNELARIYSHYLGTTKDEKELALEISDLYWRRRKVLHLLGRLGLLNNPNLANLFVSMLSLKENQIPLQN